MRPKSAVLLLAFLASPALPARGTPPGLWTQAQLHQVEKSVLVANESTGIWRLRLLSPEPAEARTPGRVEVWSWDAGREDLVALGSLKEGEDLVLEPGAELLLSPVPAKPLAASLGLRARPGFNRLLALRDRGARLVVLRLRRAGTGDKVPLLTPEHAREGSRPFQALRFRTEEADLPALVLRRPDLR